MDEPLPPDPADPPPADPPPNPVDQATQALEILRVAREQGEAGAQRHAELMQRIVSVSERQDAIDARHGEFASVLTNLHGTQSEMARMLGELHERTARPPADPPPRDPPADPPPPGLDPPPPADPPPAPDPTPVRRRRYV